ncbi:fas-binding factor 1-like isoform X1 [Acropora muricata]|uniref:fas-binding factor 1-like isoform X1 n=1 Tax=Acropora muricata TaxID=159855 RepID=UPI0034E53037
MRKGGGSFPGSGFGRKSTVGSNASNRAALDHDLDSILSGEKDDDLQRTASQPQQKSKTSVKKGSLTSGTTDEDFYSSLAQMAGEGFDDDDESISEADAKKMADSLAGLDDMESDLFGGSLGRSATPSKVSKPAKTSLDTKNTAKPGRKPSEDSSNLEKSNRGKDISPEPAKPNAKGVSSLDQDMNGTKPKTTGNPRKKYDFGEFDEDDPLAGLLSDEEDNTVSKPKPKTSVVTGKAKSTEMSSQGSQMERPKSSRGRKPANQERAMSPSPPATPEHHQPTVGKEKNANKGTSSPVSQGADGQTDSRGKDSGSPRRTPQSRERETSAQKVKPSKDEIKFDSDEDLPGLDDPDKTSRDTPTPPPKTKQERTSGRNSPGSSGDIFDDGDDLPDTGTRSESPSRQSRFSELLGRKEKDDSKKQVPKSLDDFMANISSKGNTGSGAGNKKVTSPTLDESFQFGGYMPSAASSGPSHSRGGLARPDTAPSSSRRTVRFSDELGLDDDLFGRDRPSSAPSDRLSRRQQRGDGGETNKGAKPPSGRASSKMQSEDNGGEIKTKATNETDSQKMEETPPSIGLKPSGGGGGDWLGLGDDDSDSKSLDLSNTSLKTSSSFSNDDRKDTPETQGPPERQERQSSPPRRAGRYRGREGGDSDEFLRMLGITHDEQPKSRQAETWNNEKSSLFPRQSSGGSPKRGKRWRDQTSQQGSLDEPDDAAPLKEQTERSNVSTHPAGPRQEDEADSNVVKRQVSVNQDTQKPRQFQTSIARQPRGQEHSQSPQYPAMEHALAPSTPAPSLPPEATPMQTGVYPGTQASPPQPILPQTTNVSPQIGPQVYPTNLYYSQSQPPSLASQIVQNSTQSPGFRPHYPIGLQVPGQTPLSSFSPSTPQLSSEERLEMTKLKAESELQHGRLMEYQVASEHQEQQKTRLEEEVKELVKRVQGVEVDRHKRDLDAASKISECEGKIRRLELERDQLLTTIEALKTRHKDELSNIDTAHKSHLKALEESYQRREQRLKEETDLIVAQNSEKFKTLETEKADLQASNSRKVAILETAKTNEINSLKEIHRRAMEQLRQEHEDEIAQLRRLKEQEVSAATSAHAHTKSLQSLMDQVLSSTREVSTLRQKIEVTHKSGLEERELSTRARDEYLKQMQERLLRQQSENDEERARLQGLVAKMELHMREQTRQVDQERWRMSQEESRLRALQAALEDERRITTEQLSLQRAEVERARDDLVREQRTTMSQIQEERRTLATERAQLSSAHKDLISREKLKTETSVQAESDLSVTAIRIKEDAVALSVREAQLKQGEEKLKREKQEFERRRCGFDDERDRIGKLGLEVQKRSREIEELCLEAAQVRDEGEQALELAERVRANAESQRAEGEGMFLVIQEKERQLAQDRIAIAHERRLLEKDKRTGRCWQCEGRQLGSADQTQGIDSFDARDSSNPFHPSSTTTPDLLINSLELKRTLRKWSKDKEKDEEFLEQEAQFLSQLHESGSRA